MDKKKIKITGAVSGNPFYLAFHVGEVVEIEGKLADELVKAELATTDIEKDAKVRKPAEIKPEENKDAKALETALADKEDLLNEREVNLKALEETLKADKAKLEAAERALAEREKALETATADKEAEKPKENPKK